MLLRLGTLALLALSAVACAPPTLDDGTGTDDSASTGSSKKKSGTKSKSTAKDEADDDDDDTRGDNDATSKTTTTTKTPTASVPPSFNGVFTSLNNCSSCHKSGVNGAPVFFGANAAATYPLFKAKGFARAESVLVTKGAHAGPALRSDQQVTITDWITAESN